MTLRVAYQGEPGAFSEEAILAWAPSAEPLSCPDFAEAARAVLSGRAEYGLLPVENSTAGSITDVYDLLAARDLCILEEVARRIPLCLAGLRGSPVDGIRRILSHPAALSQCTRFLAGRPGITAQAVADTAGAARLVAESGDRTLAALAGRGAAGRYGLEVLAEEVQDRPDNVTRFYLVGPPGAAPFSRGRRERAVLLAETANRPGALAALLQPFASAGINLTKLETRPGPEPWTYRFILELETDSDDQWRDAMNRARQVASSLRLLGRFGRRPSAPARPVATAHIVGLGLIGGSIARDLAARGVRVRGDDADPVTLRRARASGVILDGEADASAQVLILAIPPELAPAWLREHAAQLGACETVIDVGGTKRAIVDTATELGLGNFVGTHPMAGDHRSGWEASRLGLFQGATVYVCPGPRSRDPSVALAETLWRALGARCRRLDPADHDALVARTSHLPQLLATTLALTLRQAGIPRDALGPGGLDATRLAQSSPTLWAGAVQDNRAADEAALLALQEVLQRLTAAIGGGDRDTLAAFFEDARAWAVPSVGPEGPGQTAGAA